MILMNDFEIIIDQLLIINEIFCFLMNNFVRQVQIVYMRSIHQLMLNFKI
jgi:hypothetical protein